MVVGEVLAGLSLKVFKIMAIPLLEVVEDDSKAVVDVLHCHLLAVLVLLLDELIQLLQLLIDSDHQRPHL